MTTTTILSDNGVSSGSAGIKTTGGNDGTLQLQTTTSGGTATTAVTIGTDQSVTFAQAANLPNTFGFKNRIINGAMQVWQRGTSVSVGASNVYVADRWASAAGGANVSAYQGGGVANQYAIAINGATGNTSGWLGQRIEAINCKDLVGGVVTVSFWLYATSAFSFTANVSYAASTDTWSAATGTAITSQSCSHAGGSAWQQFTFTTATIPSGGLNGLMFWISFGSGLGNGVTIALSQVQLEKGSTATSFDYRPYGTELALCQRYYEQCVGGTISNTTSGGYIGCAVNYRVSKRATPTITRLSDVSITRVTTPYSESISINGFNAVAQVNSSTTPQSFNTLYAAEIEL